MKSFKMDIGRLIMAPIFAFFLTTNIHIFYIQINDLFPVDPNKIAKITHTGLMVCFNALILILYLLRTRAKSTSKSLAANTIAILGTFLPLLLAYLSRPQAINLIGIFTADLLVLFGMVFSLYSLSHLGRNFSIIPQARNLIQSGPYKFIRHPLYAGELLCSLGAVLASFSIERFILFLGMVGCQVYRAFEEEKILADVFSEYQNYQARTVRFLPGIF